MDIAYLARIGLLSEQHVVPEMQSPTSDARGSGGLQTEGPIASRLPLVAIMPCHPTFDEEAEAALKCMPLLRYAFDEAPVLSGFAHPCRAVLRGFMLSAERWKVLHDGLAELGVHLVVSPDEYERAHYYPNTYEALASISPRATWVPVDPASVSPDVFREAVATVSQWGCKYVLLKDYVKSAKDDTQRFMKVEVGPELAELACELVRVRGRRFNRGVVFKEWIELSRSATRGGHVTNEWRLWFGQGQLLAAVPNSFQDEFAAKVPAEYLEVARRAAIEIGSPYVTIDLAETEDSWVALEAGDGGVSGPAPGQDLDELWADLARTFG